jgi:hypothetical protein
MTQSSIRWQYFPRSQRPPDHLLAVVSAFEAVEGDFLDHYGSGTPGPMRLADRVRRGLKATKSSQRSRPASKPLATRWKGPAQNCP